MNLAMRFIYSTILLAFIGSYMVPSGFGRNISVPRDYPDIATALEHCSSVDDSILLDPKYRATQGIIINKSVAIRGENQGPIITNSKGPGVLITDRSCTVTIENIAIENCNGNGITVVGSAPGANLRLSNVRISNNLYSGIEISSSAILDVESSKFEANHLNGINIGISKNPISCALKARNCIFERNIRSAAKFYNCGLARVSISDSAFSKNNSGFDIELPKGPTETSCTLLQCSFSNNGNGIVILGDYRTTIKNSLATISGCTIDGSTSSGLRFEGNHNFECRVANTIFQNNSTGIELNKTKKSLLSLDHLTMRNNLKAICITSNNSSLSRLDLNESIFETNKISDLSSNDPAIIHITAAHETSTSSTESCELLASGTFFARVIKPAGMHDLHIEAEPLLECRPEIQLSRELLDDVARIAPENIASYCWAVALILNVSEQGKAWNHVGDSKRSTECEYSFLNACRWLNDQSIYSDLSNQINASIMEPETRRMSHAGCESRTRWLQRLLELLNQYEFNKLNSKIPGVSINSSEYKDLVLMMLIADIPSSSTTTAQANIEYLKDQLHSDYDTNMIPDLLRRTESFIQEQNGSKLPVGGEYYHLFMADEYAEKQLYDEQIRHLSIITNSHTSTTLCMEALRLLGSRYHSLKKPDEAIQVLRTLKNRQPSPKDQHSVQIQIANVMIDSKRYIEAVKELNDMLHMTLGKNEELECRLFLGIAYMGLAKFYDSREQFYKICEQGSGDIATRSAYLIGYSFLVEQKNDEAKHAFTEFLKSHPDGKYSRQARLYLKALSK